MEEDKTPPKPPRKPKFKTFSQLNMLPNTWKNINENRPLPAPRTKIFKPEELKEMDKPIPKPRQTKYQKPEDEVKTEPSAGFVDGGSNKLQSKHKTNLRRRITSVISRSVDYKPNPSIPKRHSFNNFSPCGDCHVSSYKIPNGTTIGSPAGSPNNGRVITQSFPKPKKDRTFSFRRSEKYKSPSPQLPSAKSKLLKNCSIV